MQVSSITIGLSQELTNQREMDNLRSERDKTLVALRDLEMGNDELERNER